MAGSAYSSHASRSFNLRHIPDVIGVRPSRTAARAIWTGAQRSPNRMYSNNLASGSTATADANRGPGFGPDLLLDDNKQTYWAAPDETRAAGLDLTLHETRAFSVIRLRVPVRGLALAGTDRCCGRSNLRANPVEQRIDLPGGTRARHLRFTALRVLEGTTVTVAGIGVIER